MAEHNPPPPVHAAQSSGPYGQPAPQYGQPVPQYGQPTPPYGQPVPVPPKKKSKAPLIIGVIAAVLLVICGGAVACSALIGNAMEDAANDTLPEGLVQDPGQEPSGEQPADEPAEELPPGTVTQKGTLLVGKDIPAGTYRGVECGYWERVKDASGEVDAILANGNVGSDEHLTVTIAASDYAFDNSCAFLMPIDSLRIVPESGTTNEEFGTLVVGRDIHPGSWSGTATGNCYWARLSGFAGDFDTIIANDNVDPGSKLTITVKASDKGLQLGSDCGVLTRS